MNSNKTFSTRNMSGLQTIDATSISSNEIDVEILRCDVIYSEFLRGDLICDENLPKSSIVPSQNDELVNKLYVDTSVVYETLQQAYDNSVSGIKINLSGIGGLSLKAFQLGQTCFQIYDENAVSKLTINSNGDLNTTGTVNGINNTTFSYLDATSSIQNQIDNVYTGSNTFSGDNIFSGDNTFSGNSIFSGDKTFTGNNEFTGTNSYSNTTTFTGPIVSSNSNTFTGTNTFSSTLNINTNILTNQTNFGICDNKTTGTISLGTSAGSQAITIGNATTNALLSLQSKYINIGTTNTTSRIEMSANSYNIRNYVAGVCMLNYNGTHIPSVPYFYSITDLSNWTSQTYTSGISDYSSQIGFPVGSWGSFSQTNVDDYYLVLPNFGIVGYDSTGYTGTVLLNYKNITNNPVIVQPTSNNTISSVKIYFNDNELTKL